MQKASNSDEIYKLVGMIDTMVYSIDDTWCTVCKRGKYEEY